MKLFHHKKMSGNMFQQLKLSIVFQTLLLGYQQVPIHPACSRTCMSSPWMLAELLGGAVWQPDLLMIGDNVTDATAMALLLAYFLKMLVLHPWVRPVMAVVHSERWLSWALKPREDRWKAVCIFIAKSKWRYFTTETVLLLDNSIIFYFRTNSE